MTELERIYREEYAIEQLMEHEGFEEYWLPCEHDRLLVEAQAMLEADAKGTRMAYDMVVVVEHREGFPTDMGQWRYRALLATDVPAGEGCRDHTGIEAVSLKWAAVHARVAHERRCLGKG
jgi:hypothetical protein